MRKIIIGLTLLHPSVVLSDDFNCENAQNTNEINYCAGVDLEKAENEMKNYFLRSKKQHKHDPELIQSMESSQLAWTSYVEAHCDSIYTKWREGSIRGVMHLTCKTNLTQQRTYDLWTNFLTYMDSSPAVLPEPHKP